MTLKSLISLKRYDIKLKLILYIMINPIGLTALLILLVCAQISPASPTPKHHVPGHYSSMVTGKIKRKVKEVYIPA